MSRHSRPVFISWVDDRDGYHRQINTRSVVHYETRVGANYRLDDTDECGGVLRQTVGWRLWLDNTFRSNLIYIRDSYVRCHLKIGVAPDAFNCRVRVTAVGHCDPDPNVRTFQVMLRPFEAWAHDAADDVDDDSETVDLILRLRRENREAGLTSQPAKPSNPPTS